MKQKSPKADFLVIVAGPSRETGIFYCRLPLSLKRLKEEKEEEGESKKKQKAEGKRVTNRNPDPRWKLREGDYTAVFGNKNVKRPIANGCPLCPKFQIKGYCFDTCSRAASHRKLVKREEIDELCRFVGDCRIE